MDRSFLPIAGVSPLHRKPLRHTVSALDLSSVQGAEALRVASTIFASSSTTNDGPPDASMSTTVGFLVILAGTVGERSDAWVSLGRIRWKDLGGLGS
jgi:hypothetical protein